MSSPNGWAPLIIEPGAKLLLDLSIETASWPATHLRCQAKQRLHHYDEISAAICDWTGGLLRGFHLDLRHDDAKTG
jgi:hypothetical protein